MCLPALSPEAQLCLPWPATKIYGRRKALVAKPKPTVISPSPGPINSELIGGHSSSAAPVPTSLPQASLPHVTQVSRSTSSPALAPRGCKRAAPADDDQSSDPFVAGPSGILCPNPSVPMTRKARILKFLQDDPCVVCEFSSGSSQEGVKEFHSESLQAFQTSSEDSSVHARCSSSGSVSGSISISSYPTTPSNMGHTSSDSSSSERTLSRAEPLAPRRV